MHTLTLFKTNRGWMVRNTNPKIVELFGTDTLPCAFTAAADSAYVLAEIKRLNPNCRVVLA